MSHATKAHAATGNWTCSNLPHIEHGAGSVKLQRREWGTTFGITLWDESRRAGQPRPVATGAAASAGLPPCQLAGASAPAPSLCVEASARDAGKRVSGPASDARELDNRWPQNPGEGHGLSARARGRQLGASRHPSTQRKEVPLGESVLPDDEVIPARRHVRQPCVDTPSAPSFWPGQGRPPTNDRHCAAATFFGPVRVAQTQSADRAPALRGHPRVQDDGFPPNRPSKTDRRGDDSRERPAIPLSCDAAGGVGGVEILRRHAGKSAGSGDVVQAIPSLAKTDAPQDHSCGGSRGSDRPGTTHPIART